MENTKLKAGDIIKIKSGTFHAPQRWIADGEVTIDKEYDVIENVGSSSNPYFCIIDNTGTTIADIESRFAYEIVPPKPKERFAIVSYNSQDKWGDIIELWLEGEEVQLQYDGDDKWYIIEETTHRFDSDKRYRLKPPVKSVRFALYNDFDGDYVINVYDKDNDGVYEQNPDFVKWLTDRIEY
jgi:hypothetical protein